MLLEGEVLVEDDFENDGPIDKDELEVACDDADRSTDTDMDGITEVYTLALASKDSDGDLELVELPVFVSKGEVEVLGSAKSIFKTK